MAGRRVLSLSSPRFPPCLRVSASKRWSPSFSPDPRGGRLPKRALITGITGQDGSYLAEFLLAKGYEVHGLKRRASSFNTERIDHLYQDPHQTERNFVLHYGDMVDSTNLIRIVSQVRPDEVYNLAAQSHVAVSFEIPEYTAEVVGVGTLRLLEALRIAGLERTARSFIRRPLRSCTARWSKRRRARPRRSIRARLMESPSFSRIGCA